MGQYYKPLQFSEHGNPVKGWLYSHDYDNGLKLMEHSYLNNNFVAAVENLLIAGGEWHKTQIVWAGDYAESEKNTERNLYSLCNEKNKIKPEVLIDTTTFKYVVNHTKKLYVDKTKVPGGSPGWEDFHIHPLPLLTCEGNGGGGGDYFGTDNDNIVGTWARDIISIEFDKPEGYEELKFDLFE